MKCLFKELLDLVIPNKRDLIFDNIKLLEENPINFVKMNSKIFDDYFFDIDSLPDNKDLSLIVIAYYLNEESNFSMIDWNQGNEDTLYFVNSMLSSKSLKELKISTLKNFSPLKAKYLDYNSEDYMETYDFLKLCGDLVLENNFSLIELGRGNDCYEFFLIESKALEVLLRISKEQGFNMTLISSKE